MSFFSVSLGERLTGQGAWIRGGHCWRDWGCVGESQWPGGWFQSFKFFPKLRGNYFLRGPLNRSANRFTNETWATKTAFARLLPPLNPRPKISLWSLNRSEQTTMFFCSFIFFGCKKLSNFCYSRLFVLWSRFSTAEKKPKNCRSLLDPHRTTTIP